jgi:hypothetical protein
MPPRPELPKPTMSLWQKIFGAPSAPPAASLDIPLEDERTRSFSADEAAATSWSETTSPVEREHAAEDWQSTDISSTDAPRGEAAGEEDESTEQKRRPRRRRGGRGGRGRRPRDQQEDGEQRPSGRRRDADLFETPGADDFEDLDADADDDLDMDTDRGGSYDADDDASDDDTDLGDDEGASKSKPAGHRSIPSWSDAIGMIVASNMASHSQRRATSGNGGGPRGRSRGGRRRGGGGGGGGRRGGGGGSAN